MKFKDNLFFALKMLREAKVFSQNGRIGFLMLDSTGNYIRFCGTLPQNQVEVSLMKLLLDKRRRR